MTWEPWIGAVQVLIGGVLALAGQWLVDLRAQRRTRAERLDDALSKLRSASWAFYIAAVERLRLHEATALHHEVLSAADEAIGRLMLPQGGRRRQRRHFARLLGDLAIEFSDSTADWDRGDEYRQRSLNAASTLQNVVTQWRIRPKSLREATMTTLLARTTEAR